MPSLIHGTATTQRFGIVGGGMLGLALALRLRTAGHAVTVLESAPEIGGLQRPGKSAN